MCKNVVFKAFKGACWMMRPEMSPRPCCQHEIHTQGQMSAAGASSTETQQQSAQKVAAQVRLDQTLGLRVSDN